MAKHKEFWRTVKFTLFSASAGIIQFGSYALLYDLLRVEHWISYLVALILSVLWNFTLNRRFTFKSASNVPLAMLLVFAYYCVFTPVTTVGGQYLESTLGWDGNLVTLVSMALNFVTEFLYDRYVVFRKTIDTNDIAMREKKREAEKAE
ncbi:MAG TPA: GtrA family protein [Clostridia bacterium]|nr:MAG: GtrA-like protein [Firmicutes bacterium ADurb.Bin248]HOG01237.1 GtrA family protein [Clostridia bacterium]HOS18580.1 GtrA family protein [Clostridia bacterium]HPK15779.1 GtrA family protein [Clostridia bacterium]